MKFKNFIFQAWKVTENAKFGRLVTEDVITDLDPKNTLK